MKRLAMQLTTGTSGTSGTAGTHLLTGGVLLLCMLCMLCTAAADDVIMPSTEVDSFYEDRGKRPFCNAFTGCGKKRSVGAVNPMASLVDLNAEPAVAELSRQILSEAKLWEAIQEAREELARRQHKLLVGHDLASRRQQDVRNGLPAFRKRRAATPSG